MIAVLSSSSVSHILSFGDAAESEQVAPVGMQREKGGGSAVSWNPSKTLAELFASALICRIHSSWYRMLPVCVCVCQGLDLIGKLRIGVCLCGRSWLPLRHESSW